ncbi:hypothetical protein AXK11_08975 [Cephaloticoccus primus]|uniref:P-type ATPase A domain-containing protein n=1 Tax=Cephaloticoccus primus TaxID=1548207 RepID=A0A139SHN0_9BACT|nr:copper-translocating P-type ATPase [Cephaloticoccus primus]KXU34057.1 hypothetical protein AXK11_08975 [Cephaloticoccus primus]
MSPDHTPPNEAQPPRNAACCSSRSAAQLATRHTAEPPASGPQDKRAEGSSSVAAAAATAPVYMGLPHERYLRPRFYLALALAIPVLALSMGEMLLPRAFAWLPAAVNGWLQLALTTPIFFWSGAPFIRRWWYSIRERDTNMFTLTVTGTGAAYLYSVASLFAAPLFPEALRGGAHGTPLYFEATAFITTIVLLGQIIEQRTHARTDEAIRALMQLAPKIAHRIGADGQEEDVPVEQIRPGDLLRVRPGEHLPVDGILASGHNAEIDESMLTGEPLPVTKTAGKLLSAGTLNTTGSFSYRAERVGADTLLAQIVRLVEDAIESEPPIARLADRVSAWFVPIVLGIAVVTFFAWGLLGSQHAWTYGLLNAVAVLIIACPCALGLATPVSLVTGIGRGAQVGVLVKDAAALEALSQASTLVIDKTGTLTQGRPEVVAVTPVDGFRGKGDGSASDTAAQKRDKALLQLAASAEAFSEHPLARAIVHAAAERGLPLLPASDFLASPGAGVRATVAGRRVEIGRASASESAAYAQQAPAAQAAETAAASQTLVSVKIDGQFAGLIALADAIKPSTPAAIAALKQQGFKIVMATGDRQETAEAVAQKLGPIEVHAALSPADKQALVRSIQARGERVAFAGDGLNDAPALAAADVGIAMGTGTGVAIHSAGLILVKGDLAALARATTLSRATLRNIRQNLFWAFAYNSAGLPIAAGLLFPLSGWLLSPMLASVAMSLSSLSVVTNALRLRRLRF